MPRGSPTMSSGSHTRLTGAGHTSTQRQYRYLIPFPNDPNLPTQSDKLSSVFSHDTNSTNSSPDTPSSSPRKLPRYFKNWRFGHRSASNASQSSTIDDGKVGPKNITYTIVSCEAGRSHAIQFFEKRPVYPAKHENMFKSSWRNSRFGRRQQKLEEEKRAGLMLGFCYYKVPEGVEWEVLEKKVWWLEDEEAEGGGGWVLELVSECVRGRRRGKKEMWWDVDGERGTHGRDRLDGEGSGPGLDSF